MSDATAPKPYTLGVGEKATMVMVYTTNMLARGEVITKEQMRVNTWLRTQGAPDFIGIFNAHVLTFGSTGIHQSSYSEFFISTPQVLAYHILPPAKEPLDFDPSEPNRKMEPTTVLIGSFRFNGYLRMATQSKLNKYLEVARETFFSIYDVEISNPGLPSGSTLKVPIALARLSTAILANRSA